MRLLLLLLLILTGITCHAQELAYRQYTVKDGLPGSIVYQCLQDRNGFIWFATNQGVSRFDGRTFRNFSKEDGLPDNDIVKLYLDKFNNIWFISLLGIPSVFYHDSIHRLDNCGNVKAVCEDGLSDSIQMLAGNSSMSLYGYYRSADKPGKWDFALHRSRTFDNTTNLRSRGFGGILRASIPQKMNVYFSIADSPFQAVTLKSPDSEYHYTIRRVSDRIWLAFGWPEFACVASHRQGTFFITVDSLYYADLRGLRPLLSLKSLGLDQKVKDEVNSLFSENDSTLWICTRSRGLLCLKHPLSRGRTVHRLFANSFCTSIIKDQENGYWITTHSDGVYYLPNLSFYSISDIPEMAVRSVRCIRPIDHSHLVAGFSDGNIMIIDNQRFSSRLMPGWTPQEKNNRIMDIGPWNKGKMLAATDGGLYRVSRNGDRKLLFMQAVKEFCVLPDSTILAACSDRIIPVSKDGKRRRQILVTRSTCIIQKGTSLFYWGTLHGMFLYSHGAIIDLGEKFPALRAIINHIDTAPDSSLWVSTGQGLVILKGNKILQLTKARDLPSNLCKHVSFSDSTCWVSTDKGIGRIDYHWDNDSLIYTISHITEEDGLTTNDVNQTVPGGAYIWAATARGISFFSKTYISHSARPPLINITRLVADDSFLALQDTISLSPKRARLLVEVSGISFRSGKEISYEYRLKGLDSSWRHIPGNSIEFSAFPFGEYTLEVRAIDRWKNSSSNTATLFIVHPPPYWQTTWFILSTYVLMALATGAGVYIFHRNRRRKREKDYQLKKKMQDLETMALRAQMNPHFIFNCLTSIQYHIMNADIKNAGAYLHKFSTLIRQTLQNSTKPVILLRDEIKLLELYLDLEKLRLGDRMGYRIDVSPELDPDHHFIPPMIIQPYVENAVKHGIAPLQGVQGIVIVTFKRSGDFICCSVDDNGPGIKASMQRFSHLPDHRSMGISITEKRIHTLNALKKEKIHILITDKRTSQYPADGTLIELFFPTSSN